MENVIPAYLWQIRALYRLGTETGTQRVCAQGATETGRGRLNSRVTSHALTMAEILPLTEALPILTARSGS
jgi:hypothetical protein